MRLMNKILSSIFCCILSTNLSEKSIHSCLDFSAVPRGCAVSALGGAVLTPPLVGIPAIGISSIESIKEPRNQDIFLDILKKYINKSFKVAKWGGLIFASLCGAELAREVVANDGPKYCDDPKWILTIISIFGIPTSLGISLTSWIGQKLTEDND